MVDGVLAARIAAELPAWTVAGEELVGKLLLQLKNCRKRRTWPGRYSEPTALDFPAYALPSSTDLTDCGIDFAIRETR